MAENEKTDPTMTSSDLKPNAPFTEGTDAAISSGSTPTGSASQSITDIKSAEDAAPTEPETALATTTSTQSHPQPYSRADGPPPLPYNLREHIPMITLFWFLILTECTLIPIVFYFAISNLTDLRPGAMFAIITAMFGFISGGEYGLRGLRLAQKSDEYRPLSPPDGPQASRWHFDCVHLVLGQPYFVMTALMIGFSIPDPPMTRGLSIIMPIGVVMVCSYMVYTGIAHHFGWRLRMHRLSSHVVGDITPPLTFTIMEDVVGCDGGGGKAYRRAALARYNASPRFRRMLCQMLWAWSITGIIMGVTLTVIAWIIHVEVAYALGWVVPSIWGGIGAFATIKWGQRCIRIEKEKWAEDRAAETAKA